MAVADYSSCEDRVLAHEGSEYTDGVHPYDPGGPTRWGITIADARAYWKPDATPSDVRTMPRSVAADIYRTKYWVRVNGDKLPAGVDDCVFDYGVNSGWSRAGKVLRRLVNLPDNDWHVTDAVIAECNKRDPAALINAICDERMKFLESLAIWPTYKGGWTTRVKEVRLFSLQLADHQAIPVSVPPPSTPSAPATPSGKGTVKPPKKDVIINNGGTATIAAGGIAHWLGAHPAITSIIFIVGAIAIMVAINMIEQFFRAKQTAPTPGVAPVPVKT